MIDCPSENELVDLVEGHAPSDRVESMRAHIDGCDACLAAIAALAHGDDHDGDRPDDTGAAGVLPRPGERFADRYRIESIVGEGASGVVYAALDETLDRRIALKILRHLERRSPEETVARLTRESRAMARLRHPHVVTIYDVGIGRAHLWVAMELVEGQSLRAWLRSTPPVAAVLAVFRQAALGLAAAHAAGIVHRDFKPDNVLVDAEGNAYVTDFGLAAATADARVVTDEADADSGSAPTWTRSGTIIGTPAYLSPEGWRAGAVGPAADVFALCVSLFEALVGERPFGGRTLAAVQDAVETGTVRVAKIPAGVPRRLWSRIVAGLSSDPQDRPGLPEIVDALSPPERHRWWTAIVLVAIAAMGVGVVLADTAGPSRPLPHPACLVTPPPARAVPPELAQWAARTATTDGARVLDAATAMVTAFNDSRARVCAVPAGDAEALWTADLRLRCLQMRWAAFQVQLESLPSAADPLAVTRRFPDLEICEAPAIDTLLPMPRTPLREQVNELWLALTRLQERQLAGAYLEVDAELDDLIARARETGSGGLLADALYVRGSGLQFTGEYVRAREVLREAAMTAVAAGFDAGAALSFNALAYLSLEILPDLDRAEEYVEFAHAAVARVRRPELAAELRVQVQYHEGLLRYHQSRWDDVERVVAEAVTGARQYVPDLEPQFDDLRALAWSEQGRTDDAIEAAEAALRVREQRLGPEHVYVGFSHGLVAGLLADTTRTEETLSHLRQARRIFIDAFGEVNPQVSQSWQSEGLVHVATGDLEAAADAFEAAEAATTEQTRTDAWTETQLAGELELAMLRHDGATAVATATRYLEATRRLDPRAEGIVWRARAALAFAYLEAEDPTAALAHIDAWLEARAGLQLSRHDELTCMLAAGETLVALERFDAALTIVDEGLEGRPDLPPPPSSRARLLAVRAYALHGRGRDDDARKARDEAVAIFRESGATEDLAELAALLDPP